MNVSGALAMTLIGLVAVGVLAAIIYERVMMIVNFAGDPLVNGAVAIITAGIVVLIAGAIKEAWQKALRP